MTAGLHPGWCDPRCCQASPSGLWHRAAPLTFKLGDDDRYVSVGLSRVDEVGAFTGIGPVRVDLVIGEDQCPAPGDDHAKDSALTAADARLLAAALVSAAEELDAQPVVTP